MRSYQKGIHCRCYHHNRNHNQKKKNRRRRRRCRRHHHHHHRYVASIIILLNSINGGYVCRKRDLKTNRNHDLRVTETVSKDEQT